MAIKKVRKSLKKNTSSKDQAVQLALLWQNKATIHRQRAEIERLQKETLAHDIQKIKKDSAQPNYVEKDPKRLV